jgi:hypothetical protein
MPSVDLTELIVVLLHRVIGPHHRRRGRRGGRRHRRPTPAHHNHRLRPPQTLGFWSGPRPLPPIGRCTGQWIPRTMMPHHEVVTASRVLSMVGAHALTRLH